MKEKLVKMAAKKQCEGTMCPAGCCPEVNWFCCADNMYCAATEADCPMVAMKEKLVKMAAKKQCEGTMCPAGCCPEVNWFCCADNMYCAATEADCPMVAMKQKLVKMAAKKQCEEPCAPLDVAQKSTGSAVLTTCTVLLPKLIAQWLS